MIQKRYKLRFSDENLQESVAYILVSKFNIQPNILRAEVRDDGGVMVLEMKGTQENIDASVMYLSDAGISIRAFDKQILKDQDACVDCGACISVCPTKCFTPDPETWEIVLNYEKCIACGTCLNACPFHALSLPL